VNKLKATGMSRQIGSNWCFFDGDIVGSHDGDIAGFIWGYWNSLMVENVCG